MGFFGTDVATDARRKSQRLPIDMLHRNGCKLCPLDRADIQSPKMEPTGSKEPWVLCVGEAPGEDEDKRGAPFVGKSGRLLRSNIPRKWENHIRYANVISCWPGQGNPDPTEVQVECCRPRLISDIEGTQPPVIFGFGNHALQWVIGRQGITEWRGRRLPVRVGSHTAWFYPMLHPSFVLHSEVEAFSDLQRQADKVFAIDMARAFAELPRLPDAVVHTAADARSKLASFRGSEPGALRAVREHLERAAKAKRCGVDYETYPKRPYANGAKILSAAVSVAETSMAFVFDHHESEWSLADRAELAVLWTEFLMSEVVKAAHFAGFELEWSGVMFGRETVRASSWIDTACQAWVLDERTGGHSANGPLSLGWLTQQYFGLDIKKLSKLNRKNLDAEPLGEVLSYNGIDSRYHDYVSVAQEKLLRERSLLHQFELMNERIPTVTLTQMKGLPVDRDATSELNELYSMQLREIETELDSLPEVQSYNKKRHDPFSPTANDDVKDLLRSELKVFLDSSDEEHLKEVDHPISPLIIRHRKVSKRKSTYVEPYTEEGCLWPDGLLHPNFNIVFTKSARSSADEPSVQNVIKHQEEGKVVRKQIRARPGHLLVSVDQGQIQARNVAMESGDPVFCKMLWEDYDIHMDWAERISREYPDAVGGRDNFTNKEIMGKFRQKVKNKWVFARFFNAQLPTLSSGMEIPEMYLKGPFREWDRVFSGIGSWHDSLYRQYRDDGYITNAEGFVFRAPLSPNQIVNLPIQCDEALILFSGFNRLSERDEPLLQANNEVHDDLIFELPIDEVERCTAIIVDDMLQCDFDWVNVPLSVEVSTGETWYDMHEQAKYRSDHWHGTPTRAREFM